MAVNKVVYKHFEVKISPAAAHAVDALLFGCGKINNDLNPDYNADLVNSVAFRASECTITRVVRKNADDESTVLYDGTAVNDFYLEYEPEDENDNGLFSITVKKSDGTDAMKVVTVPYGTNRHPVYSTQDEALRARMTQAEDDIDDLETRMTTAENDIDDLETRMTAAENDIDDLKGLETRMTQAEDDIDGLETRMTTAEDDVEEVKETVSQMGPILSQAQADSAAANEKASAVNTTIHSTEKSAIGYESGSPSMVSPYTLGDTIALTPDQIAAFGFGPDVPHKLGWSEFSIKPVIKPPAAVGDRSFIWVKVTLNQDAAGGYQETSLTATLSGFFMGDEILVWRYFHEIGLFVPYFKSLQQPGGLASAGIYPRVLTANIGGNMYTRPNFSQNVASIHISSAASDNLSFNGGFSLNRYNVPPYFTE